MATKEIGLSEAKTRWSKLLKEVNRGRVYRITKRGKPVAELRPIELPKRHPKYGADRGRVIMHDNFDDPLPEFEKYMK